MSGMLPNLAAALIDLDGVLYVEERPIPGAVEAIERLRESGPALRFVDEHDGAFAGPDA